jgi:protein-S-isoprenylcysteine O-methyltransferase Ste14
VTSTKTPKRDPRPLSAVSNAVGLAGLAGLILAIVIARNFGALAAALGFPNMPALADGPLSAIMAAGFCGLPMVLWSLCIDKVHRNPSTGLNWSAKRPVAEVLDTSIVKIAGLWATWAIIALVYATFRFYWNTKNWNFPFSMQILQQAALPLIIASVPYVVWLDRYMVHPRDGSWHMGAWIAGRKDWDREEIFHHLRAWAVKGFFLAFMIQALPGGFRYIVNIDFAAFANNPVTISKAAIEAMFVVDVQLATVGYLLTIKPLDAHIRTANPYLAGWMAALICYPPFILMSGDGIFNYLIETRDWAFWFSAHPKLLAVWGAVLVMLTGIYAWATMAFGLRFSNLTHRGILTHGPYRWTKHPAYLSKNLFWWLSTLPFLVVNNSLADSVRNVAIITCVSGIYYWRAKTEEKHLMADPAYREYAAWMDRNALIPRFFGWAKGLAGGRLGDGSHQIQPAE